MGRMKEAIAIWEEALARDPKSARAASQRHRHRQGNSGEQQHQAGMPDPGAFWRRGGSPPPPPAWSDLAPTARRRMRRDHGTAGAFRRDARRDDRARACGFPRSSASWWSRRSTACGVPLRPLGFRRGRPLDAGRRSDSTRRAAPGATATTLGNFFFGHLLGQRPKRRASDGLATLVLDRSRPRTISGSRRAALGLDSLADRERLCVF
jgi:hypothetical protein